MKPRFFLLIALTLLSATGLVLGLADRKDIIFADFEGETYDDWKTTGTAFGNGPARGTLPGQMFVSGFRGKGLVNSFLGGDKAIGTLISPEFKVERKSINFLIGGGGFPGTTCMNLRIDGKVVRTSTGPNTEPGGSEELEPAGWDVSDFAGKTAVIEIVDNATDGWGHVNIDQIVFTDAKPIFGTKTNATRAIKVNGRYLFFPVKTGAPQRQIAVLVAGKEERLFDIELANEEPDWWAALDVTAWKGQTIILRVNKLPGGSRGLDAVASGDTLKGGDNLYREALRPQLHFSSRRGWLNDPNGLVYVNGTYHLFFQHNPYGWAWGNMHWGHAVSKDLLHWDEQGEALYPDALGPMFSGSAVVDRKNTSGFGTADKPPVVLFYTAAGNPTVQCLAYSTDDGKTFTKYAGNPIIKQITPGNRDPKVLWHEPTRRWVMVLYVETAEKKHVVQFFSSANLKDWKPETQIEGFFECPDLFELPVDGDGTRKKWVLTAASSEYVVGSFDGTKFTPETPKLHGHRGRGFYAAQTFSDLPEKDGRRLQIGWLQAPSPGMPFNQAMSVPLELNLVGTHEGPRLTWAPARELETLRGKKVQAGPLTLKPGAENPLASVAMELMDLILVAEPGKASEISLTVRGVPVVYDMVKQELAVNGHRTALPVRNGKVDLRILVDRTVFEVFADNGRVYIPIPVIPKAEDRSVSVSVKTAAVVFPVLEVHEMKSIWERKSEPQQGGSAEPAKDGAIAKEQAAGNVCVRGGLNNARIQFTKNKIGHVAFLGGSITEMNGYRPLVCESLVRRFPGTKFTFTNAGIASTCSTTGAFRLAADVLDKGPVDLLFVEFAVNDDQDAHHSREECIRGLEGIVRHLWKHNPNADVVISYFVNPEMIQTIKEGKTPLTISSHEEVARACQVPSVNVASELVRRMQLGQLTWQQYGGVHPARQGNELAARLVDDLLNQTWNTPLPADAALRKHVLPEKPLEAGNYENGRLIDVSKAKLTSGWKVETPDWSKLAGDCRERFRKQTLLDADKPGAELTLEFEGKAIGVYVLAGPDAGIVEAAVDEGPFKPFDLYHAFSGGLHYPRTVVFAADLKPGRHTLKLRLTDKHNPASKGTAARVLYFIAN